MKLLLLMLLAGVALGNTVVLEAPLGLDLHMPIPERNPLTRAKVALGRKLFFDKRLSRDGTLACSTCHDPGRAFSDGSRVARGVNGHETLRNAPTLVNRGYGRFFFWDGRAPSLEQQALGPIMNPGELGLTERELQRRTGMNARDVTDALASYVRTIRSGDSRFDRYVAGQTSALTALEKAGLRVFRETGGCVACHVGPSFTDEQFHNTGVAWRDGRLLDLGRFSVSANDRDRGAFKTPTLREIDRTAPYMHDGSLTTLEEVIDFYSEGGRPNPFVDPEIRPRDLTAADKRALAAFLRSLTGRVFEGL